MSYTFTLTQRSSHLTSNINPPIELDDDGQYMLGLINFESYNSIPNITEALNNSFYFGGRKYELPTGSYDVKDIATYLQKNIILQKIKPSVKDPKREHLIIKPNRNTLKCEILGSKNIDFTKNGTFRELLGFKPRILEANNIHISDYPVNILKVNAICVTCNLTTGSYNNGDPTHILHEFFPNVEPGEKIIESPQHAIYMPINTNIIDSIIVQIQDQDGDLINFREEVVTLRLHLKKL